MLDEDIENLEYYELLEKKYNNVQFNSEKYNKNNSCNVFWKDLYSYIKLPSWSEWVCVSLLVSCFILILVLIL
jgi:hypothetical protein